MGPKSFECLSTGQSKSHVWDFTLMPWKEIIYVSYCHGQREIDLVWKT